MAEKLNSFYKLLNAEVPINITSELKGSFDSVNTVLSDARELALKQPISRKQLVLMTMQASDVLNTYSSLEIIGTKRSNQRGKRTHLSRLDQKYFPAHNSKSHFTQKNFWLSTSHSLSSHTSFGKNQSQQLSQRTKNQSPVYSAQKLFYHLFGMLATMCCSSLSK